MTSQEILLAALHRRAERLVRLTELEKPPQAIVALFVKQILQTAIPLCGKDLAQEWITDIVDDAWEAHGICRFCRENPLNRERGMCDACWAEVDDRDKGEPDLP